MVPCYENTTPSVKPEINNVSPRRQRRTEPWPRATCAKKFVKFGRAVFESCERTDGLTDRQTDKPVGDLVCAPPLSNFRALPF